MRTRSDHEYHVDARSGHVISRRGFLKAAAALGAAAAAAPSLAGCGGEEAENGELNLFIWTEYVPEDLIDQFAEEFGVSVNTTMYSSNEDMYSRFTSGDADAFDVLLPSDYMVERLISAGLLQELDADKLENLGNIAPQYLGRSCDPDNSYSVPYSVSMTGLAYTPDLFAEAPTSWEALWGSECEGSLVVLDDPREVLGMVQRTLGMSGNEIDPDLLDQVREKALELKPNIQLYDSDSPKSALISGDAAGGLMWSAEIALAQRENDEVRGCFPEEGCVTAVDSWVIPAEARNVENAMKFIDFMLRPESARTVSETYPYIQPNQAALELLGDDFRDNPLCNAPAEVAERGYVVSDLDADALELYNDIWNEMKQ